VCTYLASFEKGYPETTVRNYRNTLRNSL